MKDYPVLSSVSRCYPSPRGTFFTRYSPVRPGSGDVNITLTIDLHVLSILSAFILSQDQTLHSTLFYSPYFFIYSSASSCSVFIVLANQSPRLTKIILSKFTHFVNTFFLSFFPLFFKTIIKRPFLLGFIAIFFSVEIFDS